MVVVTVLAAVVVPVRADEPAPPPDRSPRIVGGEVAPPGTWPAMAALYRNNGFRCGGTVVDASWILTAAHCVSGLSANQVTVLTGTQNRASGGSFQPARSLRIIDGYTPNPDPHRDVALVHLADPTSAPLQALLGQGGTVPSGTPATAAGWGSTGSGGVVSTLRQVDVPVLSDQQCRNAGWGSAIVGSSMLCAGQGNGQDTCVGDSGGPLVIDQGGTKVQIGITSWGAEDCGILPGVYAEVGAFSSWIRQQIRYGPHADAVAFVQATYRDLFDRNPSGSELLTAVARLLDGQTPASWATGLITGPTYQGRTGAVTRLYRGFFLRNPDTPGMAYWWSQVNSGRTVRWVADFMATSPEFIDRYGHLGNSAFVDRVYQNVLDRPADPQGKAFWTAELNSGRRSRGQVMLGFTESSEYRNRVQVDVDVIISFFGLTRRVPLAGDVTFWRTRPLASLVGTILLSPEYALRY